MVSMKDLKKLGGKDVTDTIKEWAGIIKQWFIDSWIVTKDFFMNMPLWLQILLMVIVLGSVALGVWYVWRNRDQIPLFYG